MKRLAIPTDTALAHIRPHLIDLETENIASMAARAASITDLIPLWYGESDLVTPEFIRDAAKASLDRGETRYVPQMGGHPALAAALSTYQTRLHGRAISTERSTVTPGGMQAVMMAATLVAGPGANVVYIEPQWPNIRHVIHMSGAEPRAVSLDHRDGRWTLDLARLFDACDARTAAIMFSTPSNPCGWTASREEMAALLEFSRKTGVWIISDEMYGRLYFEGDVAPSILQQAEDEDLVLAINGFSKSWAMTGWRIGWLSHPASTAPVVRAMTQYLNSGIAPFVQQGAIAALEGGEPLVHQVRDRCRAGLEAVHQILGQSNRIILSEMPAGGMYAFFRLADEPDSARACLRILDEAHVGLAPGALFGTAAQSYIRLCVCNDPALIREACSRIATAVG